jgi:hypothetical protein
MTNKWEFLRPIVADLRKKNPAADRLDIAKALNEIYNFGMNQLNLALVVDSLWVDEKAFINEVLTSPYITERQREIGKAALTPQPVLHKQFTKPGNYLVLGCWHVPFNNKDLTQRVFELMDSHTFEGLVINGDFLDLNTLSGHDKGKFTAIPGLTLDQEYQYGKEVLDQMVDLLPDDAAKVFLYGNHENRWQRFVGDMQNAKTPPKSPTQGLGLFENGFTVVDDYSNGYITLGKHLDVLHGVYYNTHCAKAHIDKLRGSVLFNHTHRIQSFIEGNTRGFNIGWGGDVTHRAFSYADRTTRTSWQNGFAVVTIDEEGRYYVQQVVCNDSRFVFGGKQY